MGGLYNHDTQKKTKDYYAKDLYNVHTEMTPEDIIQLRKEDQYPTTRQGDENEESIMGLYRHIENLWNRVHTLEENEEKNIKKQQEQLNRLEGSMRRMIEGVYDQQHQNPVLTHELELLMGDPISREKGFLWMDEECDVYPTTQQGFRLEKRIAELEIAMEINQNSANLVYQENARLCELLGRQN